MLYALHEIIKLPVETAFAGTCFQAESVGDTLPADDAAKKNPICISDSNFSGGVRALDPQAIPKV